MKTKRIKLEDLKIRSFVTTIKESENVTIKGGIETNTPGCTDPVDTTTLDTNGAHCAQDGGTIEAYCTQV